MQRLDVVGNHPSGRGLCWMLGNADPPVHDLRPSVLAAVRTGRCTSPSLRESPEGLGSLVACFLDRQADIGKEMVFSISQFAELTCWRLRSIQTSIAVDSCVRRKGIILARPETVARLLCRVGLADIS